MTMKAVAYARSPSFWRGRIFWKTGSPPTGQARGQAFPEDALMDGGAQRCATGLENRADRKVVGSTPGPSATFLLREASCRPASEHERSIFAAGCRSGNQAPDQAHILRTRVQIALLQPVTSLSAH